MEQCIKCFRTKSAIKTIPRVVTGFIFLCEFHFFITSQLEFSDQDVTVWRSKTSPCSGRPKGKSIHPLFKECFSSQRRLRIQLFPAIFQENFPWEDCQHCCPVVSPRAARSCQSPPWLLGAVSLPRWMQSPCSASATGRDCDLQVCQALQSPEQAPELTPPSGSGLGKDEQHPPTWT